MIFDVSIGVLAICLFALVGIMLVLRALRMPASFFSKEQKRSAMRKQHHSEQD